jgi:dephospho-CoA kinase
VRVALTGGIATGKSYCARRFRHLGVPVIDADELAHAAVARGTAGLAAVTARFGSGVLLPSGDLDRGALGALVFADPAARKDLEAIIHPLVYAEIDRWFLDLKSTPGVVFLESSPRPGFGSKTTPGVDLRIADIPLLYETGHAGDFSRVIVAACPPEIQLERLASRGLSEAEARQRLASQLPIADKVRRADHVIDTSGPFDETDRQVTMVLERLSKTG